ncbi:spore coat protein [Peribacillus alkalitolerans]|uniref:spore coat protein n=1 Tax=Peribacillus alkalitolerans TaxID=1550385 RepID=UPI0013D0B2CD|nr:spore coat protein [Peribacillus alkalitolerans]
MMQTEERIRIGGFGRIGRIGGFVRPFGSFGRPFGFGRPFLGGLAGGLLASTLLYPGYGYGYPAYSYYQDPYYPYGYPYY